MYIICFKSFKGNPTWFFATGEEDMQKQVNAIMTILDCERSDIMVFNLKDQLQ